MGFDYYRAGMLYDLIVKAGPFSEDRAKFYMAVLVQGLSHAHDKNVVIRDIKLENILLSDKGYPEVILYSILLHYYLKFFRLIFKL